MTTAPSQQPRDRALGRGVNSLIPQAATTTPADQATSALAGLRTVPVHVGVLRAAVVLLEEASRTADDDTKTVITSTVELLHEAIGKTCS
ncbi:hypothetical protein [Streptomyces sp. SAJ15]|uniref:hypothetical protein n=1 Tax=Streptomyces sp. SAJ15 TaxID=2011095 RepID=UPI0011868409|nr:hypothetical protein [Streptomyces sp. SAJ15]TVL87783.1 hypothetical protein CD790_32900 [Streptomyces sp. SAJ15]